MIYRHLKVETDNTFFTLSWNRKSWDHLGCNCSLSSCRALPSEAQPSEELAIFLEGEGHDTLLKVFVCKHCSVLQNELIMNSPMLIIHIVKADNDKVDLGKCRTQQESRLLSGNLFIGP